MVAFPVSLQEYLENKFGVIGNSRISPLSLERDQSVEEDFEMPLSSSMTQQRIEELIQSITN